MDVERSDFSDFSSSIFPPICFCMHHPLTFVYLLSLYGIARSFRLSTVGIRHNILMRSTTEDFYSANDSGSSVKLETEVQESFMTYAMSIILGRALPDARDGLKVRREEV